MVLEIGKTGTLEKIITEKDILDCAGVTGDYNPIHTDKEAAVKAGFKGQIAHGVLSIGLISAVLGTKMPGPGTILLEQNIKYKRPVYIGDHITAECKVSKVINETKQIYHIETRCYNQNEENVMEGYAVIKYSSPK